MQKERSDGYYKSATYKTKSWEGEKYETIEWEVEQYVSSIYSRLNISDVNDRTIKTIEKDFEKKTSIINKRDLSILSLATAIMVAKGILFQFYAEAKGYGQKIDTTKRLDHNDKAITDKHRKSNDLFRDKNVQKHGTGDWINLVYQTPPYDITKGSPLIGRNMEGGYHRVHTLGHDPVLGWIFGTANILTDTITFEDFASYRVTRKPMRITNEHVPIPILFKDSYDLIMEDKMYLAAALFAEGAHLASDRYTKLGLPVPLLEAFNPEFASALYKSQYDELCLQRDISIIGQSASFACIVNMIVGLIHGLFYNEKKDHSRELYEVRTRKILSISNTIGTASNIVATIVEQKPTALDIGGLLVTISRLFTDIRFITKVREEYLRENK
ncbi:hypothetical protein [Butyrivibrio sp. WCE2006]|uniref:hypothetical protein n=1 Tax=Butyrivibrio sp. WCE2006 TaxID=1410611 RepID=UPI000678B17C|nr:hypothetical protein [Butyrivibrio sp. WCE2006]